MECWQSLTIMSHRARRCTHLEINNNFALAFFRWRRKRALMYFRPKFKRIFFFVSYKRKSRVPKKVTRRPKKPRQIGRAEEQGKVFHLRVDPEIIINNFVYVSWPWPGPYSASLVSRRPSFWHHEFSCFEPKLV
jgi:hypothetical protein